MNRSCEEYRELAALLPDGELSQEEENDLRAHTETCPECRCCLTDYDVLSCALREFDAEPPELLVSAVLRDLQSSRSKRGVRFLPGIAAAACLIAVSVLSIRYFHGNIFPPNPGLGIIESYSADGADENGAVPESYLPALEGEAKPFSEDMGAFDAQARASKPQTPEIAMIPGDIQPPEGEPSTKDNSSQGDTSSRDDTPPTGDTPSSVDRSSPEDVPSLEDVPSMGDAPSFAVEATSLPQNPEQPAPEQITPATAAPLPDASTYALAFVSYSPIPETALIGEWNGAFYYLYPGSAEEFDALTAGMSGSRYEGTGQNYIVVFVP